MASQSSRSNSYKQYQRTQRKIVNEGIFTGGMEYSDNPLEPGRAKLIVNMDQKDYGKRIRPRGGRHLLTDPISLGALLPNSYIHHTGTIFVENTQTGDVYLRRYALILNDTEDKKYGTLTNSKMLIEVESSSPGEGHDPLVGEMKVSTLKEDTTIYKIKHDPRDSLVQMHNMVVEKPSAQGMFVSLEGNTYLLTDEGLGRLHAYFDGTSYTHEVKLVTPLRVTPTQAVNYGYNLLLDNPYHFPNKSGVHFMPEGILPYDAETGLLKMQAKVGEKIRFKLIHQYREDEEYQVKWEVRDIQRRDETLVVQKLEDSPKYKNGEDIYLDYESPLKQFSVIATVYKADDHLNPLRVVILASYHLSDDSVTNKFEPRNHDLKTAKGITLWKNQIVYWGVSGAEMSIFIGDVNDPTYVPFPNHAVIYNEKVLKCFPYLDSMIVVTENSIHQVDMGREEGYITKPVQANLQLRDDDASSMYGVRNLICFKHNNYYYMVVPNIKNDRGELQIAPISERITILLDEFSSSTRKIISEVYTVRYLFQAPDSDIRMSLYDYYSFPDGTKLRHVYKLKIDVKDKAIFFADFHIVYNTIFRSWTIEIMESTRRPLVKFQSIATGNSQSLGIYEEDNMSYVQWVGVDPNDPHDTFKLDGGKERTITNFQMFDTGKRDVDGIRKKRIRQVILEMNNLSDRDVEFNHILYMDDDERSDFFKYEVVHVTDPTDPNYGRIYVERTITDPSVVYGTTMLDLWSLGNSQFPEQTLLKIHLDASGKGYYPRLRLITRTSQPYELNQITWAYRDMNAR